MFYWFAKAMKSYAKFNGRARRREFWYFNLLCMLIAIPVGIIDNMMGTEQDDAFGTGPLYLVYCFATFIPSLAVAARRMHDTGHSGWYCLIPFYNLYLCCLEGTTGENAYGPDPKNENDSFDFEQNQFADSKTI